MIEVINYQVNRNVVSAGFKQDDYVVYGSISDEMNLTKQERLQSIFENVKQSLDYEAELKRKGQSNAITTEEVGEKFNPIPSRPVELNVDFSDLTGEVLNQYGDVHTTDIDFYVEGSENVTIQDGVIIEGQVEDDEDYKVIARYEDLVLEDARIIKAIKPSETELIQDELNRLSISVAYKQDVNRLQQQISDTQAVVVDMQYEDLIKQGGNLN